MGETTLVDDIASVFSILPDEQADEARREVLERYFGQTGWLSDALHWAEFGGDGAFLRGGITQTADLSTRLVTVPQSDAEIAALISNVSSRDTQAGRLGRAAGSGNLHWFVPHQPLKRDTIAPIRLKGLSISESLFSETLLMFNEGAKLTPAELRIAFQLISGSDPREAADEDAVSVETKRAQIKSACSKLDCSGQSDLIRLVLGQLVHLLYVTEAETAFTQSIEEFAAKHLGDKARFSVRRLPNGHLLRLFESGPEDGRPIIAMHGLLYLFLQLNARDALEKHNIRLIMPIRSGYLEDQSGADLYEEGGLTERALEDIALFAEHTFETPVPLIGHSLGSVPAIGLASRYPERFSQVILLSPHFAEKRHSQSHYAEKFFGGFRDLAAKPNMFRYLTWQFRKYYVEERTVKGPLRRLFRRSDSDVQAMDGKIGSGPAYGWFVDSYRGSIIGIAEDMRFIMQDWRSEFAALPMPVTCIHGPDDPITEREPLEAIIGLNPHAQIKWLPEGGHLASASHPEIMWGAVAEQLA